MSRLDWLSTRPPENLTVSRHAQKLKVSRAPMVNPYDKFTQPEFDAWIGDITSSLRRALGFEQDGPCFLEKTHANGGILEYPQLDLSDQDEVPDDSFAQIKKRRDKGKARDPREGPGLGRDRTQPIDVVSSDEEEEDEVKDLAFSLRDDDDDDTYDQNEDSESDYLWEKSSPSNNTLSSPPIRIGPPSRSRQKSEVEESNTGTGDDSDEYDEYDDDGGDSVNQANDTSEVISISSDEDESVDEEDEDRQESDYHNRPGPSSSRYPRDESYEDDDTQGVDGEADEVQPLDHDTSFPPRYSSPRRNLELNDPWEAPRIYAEDFYSGGELRFPAGAHVHPDHLGPLDEGTDAIEEGEGVSRPDEVDYNSETLSNLRSDSEFYQTYYEGNAVTSWNEQSESRFFAHTEDVDIGIDSFLSPGVFTPNQSELRTHLNRTEHPIETESNHQSVQPLPALTSSKRNEPIPQDAEIIALDDSDEDEDDSVEVIPPLDAILEVVTEPATMHHEDPEVSEESQTNYSSPFVPVVENLENVGDEGLSVHTAHTEDIEHESCLQPFEIVKPEEADLKAAQESVVASPNLGPAPSEVNGLDLEERDNPVEPEDILLNAVDTLPLDARSKSITVEVDNQTPNYYEDFDDIYETSVPEILPPDPSEGGHLRPAELVVLQTSELEGAKFLTDILMVSQDIEVEKSRNLAESPGRNAEIELNDNIEVYNMGGQFPLLENNSESTLEENSLETSRNGAINVDVQNLRRSATPNGLEIADSTSSSPRVEEPLLKTPEFTTNSSTVLLSPSRISVPGHPRIPMPVMADATVPDPTESPTRLQEHPILSIPGTPNITVISLKTPQVAELVPSYPSFLLGQLLHSLNSNADGLFTPADFSTTTTPAEDNNVAILSSEWQEADVTTSKTAASDDLHAQTELTLSAPSPKEVGDILTLTDITPGRKSVLMADPYPYCLSTPSIPVPTSDDGSSEENDDNSICSHSSEEKENEQIEVQPTFPLEVDIEPHINSQPVTTEFDISAPLTEFDLQAMTTSAQNLLEDTMVEELGSSPTMDEKDILVAMELQYPTMGFEDSPAILADASGKDSEEQVASTTLQPLGACVDASLPDLLQENLEGNPETPLEEKKETDATIPEDLHLQETYQDVKWEGIPHAAEAISPESRPSKRKRGTSPDPDRSDSFSVKSKGKLRAKSKGKQRGKAAETCIVEQPERDTIYVRSTPVKRPPRDFSTSEISESSSQSQTSIETGVTNKTSEFSIAEVSQPPHPQFHAPSLFHAHGRTRRQKSRIQPIASVKQTQDHDDQHPAPQLTTLHTSALENPSLRSGRSRKPSSLRESVLPTTAGAIVTEVQQAALSDAPPSTVPSQLTVATPVPAVESLIQEDAPTFPHPSSIAAADKNSKPTPSTPTTTVAFPPAPSLQSSPARFLQASNSLSSIRSTRSQCKYHKITLPIGENGRRVCFLVPGCSLTNQELMKEEDIEDHGEAKYEDSLRMIQNIDHLDFDQYLIGILRQLVGLDILREGEVFYLPQPGDDVQRKHWPRKSNSERTSKGSDYTSFAGSPGYSYSGSARSPSTRPPLSNADSVFTSLSGIATADDESDQSPSKGKASNTWKGKTKEEPYEEPTQTTPPKSTKRGVKRTRTFDGATGNDGTRKSKRLRLQLTEPSLHQTQHD